MRTCEHVPCKKPLARKVNESLHDWQHRMYCDALCARAAMKARMRAGVEASKERPRWRRER